MWERNIDWLPPIRTLTRDQTHKLGMCCDQKSNFPSFFFVVVYIFFLNHTGQGLYVFKEHKY